MMVKSDLWLSEFANPSSQIIHPSGKGPGHSIFYPKRKSRYKASLIHEIQNLRHKGRSPVVIQCTDLQEDKFSKVQSDPTPSQDFELKSLDIQLQ